MWHAMFGKVEKTEKKAGKKETKKANVSFVAMVRESGLVPIFCSIVMMGFLRDGIESWLPTLYSEAFNRDASESVLFSAILPVFSILSILVITALHKKPLFNNEACGSALTFLVAIVSAIPLFFLIEFEHPVLRIVCLVLAALVTACMHACNFLLISCLPGRFARIGRVATASGFCNAFTYIGAAISMYGIALVAENLGWQFTVLSWIGIALFGAFFSFLAMRRYTRFINEE
jgi:OPA family glycerol-3-phosphate transporter-like MFS transporter